MATVLYPITACFKKTEEDKATSQIEEMESGVDDDKKKNSQNAQPGLIWRVSSGLYSIGSGAVGLGVGSVKWAASTTYNVGTSVVSATQNVASKVGVTAKPKPKKE